MLYIIVPVHNNINSTIKFLNSLDNQAFKAFTSIVVNDGSIDGTTNTIKKMFPDSDIVEGTGDLYWGGSINLGLEYLKKNYSLNEADLIAFANNDIVFVDSCIEELLNKCEETPDAYYHPITVNNNDVCLSSGGKIINWPLFLTHYPFRGNKHATISVDSFPQINLATARFLLFNAKLLGLVSNIDAKNFKHYAGDNDFSMQLWKKGIPGYIIPRAKVILDTTKTGNNPNRRMGIWEFAKSLFSIKSTNNILIRYKFGLKHCPVYAMPCYFVSVATQLIIRNFITGGFKLVK
ncbi:MAG: glycosyltransferase [Chitinivibrionales bacterium]|nr:glycosyltransferase [Chitinivibrionales bacterium]